MKKLLPLMVGAAILAGCGSQKATMKRNMFQAGNLMEFSKGAKVSSPTLQKADSLYKVAYKAHKEGDVEQALWHAEYAQAYYQMALMERHLVDLKAAIEQATKDYGKDSEHLTSLKDVYDEIKTLRKQ